LGRFKSPNKPELNQLSWSAVLEQIDCKSWWFGRNRLAAVADASMGVLLSLSIKFATVARHFTTNLIFSRTKVVTVPNWSTANANQ